MQTHTKARHCFGERCRIGGGRRRDHQAGSGKDAVTVALLDTTLNQYWNGATFGSGVPVWSTATFVGTSSGTWSWVVPTNHMSSPNTYKISSRVRDQANNQQQGTFVTTNTFVYDVTAPVALAGRSLYCAVLLGFWLALLAFARTYSADPAAPGSAAAAGSVPGGAAGSNGAVASGPEGAASDAAAFDDATAFDHAAFEAGAFEAGAVGAGGSGRAADGSA